MTNEAGSPTADTRHICDYPECSERGSGHPLACNCRSASAGPAASDAYALKKTIEKAQGRTLMAAKNLTRLWTEFDGDPSCCGETLNELFDAADQLAALEATEI